MTNRFGWQRSLRNVWHYVIDEKVVCGAKQSIAGGLVEKLHSSSGGHACLQCMTGALAYAQQVALSDAVVGEVVAAEKAEKVQKKAGNGPSFEPCVHHTPDAAGTVASELHGVCIFCWRDWWGAQKGENLRLRTLLWRAVRREARKQYTPSSTRPLWDRVGLIFGLGATMACELCRELGFDHTTGEELIPEKDVDDDQ